MWEEERQDWIRGWREGGRVGKVRFQSRISSSQRMGRREWVVVWFRMWVMRDWIRGWSMRGEEVLVVGSRVWTRVLISSPPRW